MQDSDAAGIPGVTPHGQIRRRPDSEAPLPRMEPIFAAGTSRSGPDTARSTDIALWSASPASPQGSHPIRRHPSPGDPVAVSGGM